MVLQELKTCTLESGPVITLGKAPHPPIFMSSGVDKEQYCVKEIKYEMLYIYTTQSHICINHMHIPHTHSTHSHANIHYLPDINRTIKVVLLLILLSSIFNILFYLTPVLLAIFLCVYF